jgi:23S rRNA (adenine2030-N6)-methyltransferase
MLSYQHSYHAANLVDVQKHARLAEILSARADDAPPLLYSETHAGRGLYQLNSKEARKTGEAEEGLRALSQLPQDHPYRACIRETQKRHGKHAYPGSPYIARLLLKPQDRMQLFELHPQEFAALSASMKGKNTLLLQKDGYTAMMAQPERLASQQGLLLIDPSYEIKTEYADMTPWLKKLLAKCPKLSVLLWYPILEAARHTAMCDALREAFPEGRFDEITFPDNSRLRMQGSGLWSYGALCR